MYTISEWQNIPVVVAAGNDKADACNESPAAAKEVWAHGNTSKLPLTHAKLVCHSITVAASTSTDDFATKFSNHGKCVNIIAPVSLYILK